MSSLLLTIRLINGIYLIQILCCILEVGRAMAGEHGRCPNCSSDRVVKAGKCNRGERGLEQRYLCKDCHKFTTKPIQQLELIKFQELRR